MAWNGNATDANPMRHHCAVVIHLFLALSSILSPTANVFMRTLRDWLDPKVVSHHAIIQPSMQQNQRQQRQQQLHWINRACKEIIMTVINRIASHLLFKKENGEWWLVVGVVVPSLSSLILRCMRQPAPATTFRLELGASKRVKCNFVNVIIDWWRWEMQVHSTGDRSTCALHRTLLLHIYWLCITFRCHNDNKFNNSASWLCGVLYIVQHQQQWNWIRVPCRTHNFGRRHTPHTHTLDQRTLEQTKSNHRSFPIQICTK